MAQSRYIVVDGNAPWVRSLFLAMPAGVEVTFLRVAHPMMFRQVTGRSLWASLSRKVWRDGIDEQYLAVPGWGRFASISTRIVARRIRALHRRKPCDAVCYTLPQYHAVARQFPQLTNTYYAHDPFRFYDWPPQRTKLQETAMLQACRMGFAVAQGIQEDLQALSTTPVEYLPNAISTAFLERISHAAVERPKDLPTGVRIVGCTGQINRSYDWDLIEALADACPELHFVFVGPVLEDDATPRVRRAFARPNVHGLGPKPHHDLPAYLSHFDICLNPLAVNEHSHRRSPLRLFDYLATDRPIVSTAVREAFIHRPHLDVANSKEECIHLLRKMATGTYHVDTQARMIYIQQNTWEVRARKYLDDVHRSL